MLTVFARSGLPHAFSFEEILEAAVCATVTEEGGHCVA
jgi:hypothetical protein